MDHQPGESSRATRFLLKYILISMISISVSDGTLVGSWPFGGYGTRDVSGNGNDAVFFNTDVTSNSEGHANAATFLEGTTSSYIEIQNTELGPLDLQGDFTIMGQFSDLYSRGWLLTWLPCATGEFGTHIFMVGNGSLLFRITNRNNGAFIPDGLWTHGQEIPVDAWKTFALSFNKTTGLTTMKLNDVIAQKQIDLFRDAPQCTKHSIKIGGYSPKPDFYRGGLASFCMHDEELDVAKMDLHNPCGPCGVPCCADGKCRMDRQEPESPFSVTDSTVDVIDDVTHIQCGRLCLGINCRSLYYNTNGTCLLLSTHMPHQVLTETDGWLYFRQ